MTWAIGLAAVAASLVLRGYRYGGNNQIFQIGVIFRTWWPEAYAGVPFFDTLEHYAAPLYHLIAAVLPAGADLPAIWFAAWLGGRIATFWIVRGLLRGTAFNESRQAVFASLGAALFLVTPGPSLATILGNESYLHTFFSHTELSTPLLLLAARFAFERRTVPTYVALGVLSEIHLLLGLFLGFVVFLRDIGAVRSGERRLAEIARGWALFVVVASPALWVAVRASLAAPLIATSAAEYADALGVYFPFHFFLHQSRYFPSGAAVAAIKLAWVAALVVAHLAWYRGRANAGLGRAALASLVVFVAVGGTFSAIVPSRLILNVHFFRADLVVAVVLIVETLRIATDSSVDRDARRAALVAVAFFLGGLPFAWVAFVALAAALRRVRSDRARLWLTAAAGAVALATVHGILAARSYGTVVSVSKRHVLGAALIVGPAVYLAIGGARRRFVAAALAVVLAGPILADWLATPVSSRTIAVRENADEEMAQLHEWVRTSTNRSDRFVVPPLGFDDFTALTGRAALSTWKEGAAMMWRAGYERIWFEKLDLLGIPYERGVYLRKRSKPVHDAYQTLPKERLEAFMARHPAQYGIFHRETNLPGDIVWESKTWVVRRLYGAR